MSVLTILLFLLGVLAIVLAALLWAQARSFKALFARCGKCGYVVHGVERMFCPECGTDFREGGIQPPFSLEWKFFISVWTLCLLAIGIFSSPVFTHFGPKTYESWVSLMLLSDQSAHRSYQIQFNCDGRLAGTRAGGPNNVLIPSGHAKSVTWQPAPPTHGASEVWVRVRDMAINPTGYNLVYNPTILEYGYESPAGETHGNGELDQAIIEQWLLSCGLPPGPELSDEITDIGEAISAAANGKPTFTLTVLSAQRQANGLRAKVNWVSWSVLVPFWLVIYSLGYLWFIRYRRWRARELKAAQIGQASEESSA